MDITEIGVRILFLPVILIASIIIVGLLLFVAVNIVSLIARIPAAILNLTVEETKERLEEKRKREVITSKKKFTLKEIWFQFEKGGWIVWVAALPMAILVFAIFLFLLRTILN